MNEKAKKSQEKEKKGVSTMQRDMKAAAVKEIKRPDFVEDANMEHEEGEYIGDLKSSMNSRAYRQGKHKRSSIKARRSKVVSSWGKGDLEDPISKDMSSEGDIVKTSLWKHVLLFAGLFFIVALVFSWYASSFQSNRISSDRIDLEIITRTFTDGGEVLPVDIIIANRNSAELVDVELFFEYPGRSNQKNDLEEIRRELGDLASKQSLQESFDVRLYGEPGEQKALFARIEYNIAGSQSKFGKREQHDVAVRSTPVQLAIRAASQTITGQAFTAEIDIESHSREDQRELIIDLEYPRGFTFVSADPPPSAGEDIWVISKLRSGGKKTITLRGVMEGFEGDSASIKAFVGSRTVDGELDDVAAIFHSVTHSTTIKEPFLSLRLVLDGVETEDVFAAEPGDFVTGQIFWKNTLEEPIENVEVDLFFVGTAFSKDKVTPNSGFFDSSENTILWNQKQIQEFKSIPPGEEGVLTFSFASKDLTSSNGTIVASPSLSLAASAKAQTKSGEDFYVKEAALVDVRFHSSVSLSASTYHFTGPIKNSGPIPPIAEQKTSYTLKWQIRNSANKLEDATVKTTLPTYVDWAEEVSPASELERFTYDENSREIVWDIGTIESGVGYNNAPKEVYIKVEIKPSFSHIGSTPPLTGDVTLDAKDSFTETLLSARSLDHSVDIKKDPSAGKDDSVVVRP